jgi:hypothetical protein
VECRSARQAARSVPQGWSIEIVGQIQILRNRFGSFEKAQLMSLAEEGINVGLRVLKQHLKLLSDHESIITEIIREIMSQNKTMSNEEVSEKVQSIYLMICYWVTIFLVEVIAHSISSYELMPIFKELLGKHKGSTAYGLVYVATDLHASKSIPKQEILQLYEEVVVDPLSRRMLRQIILRFLYLNHINYKDNQWLSQKIDLPIQSQLMAEKSTVDTSSKSLPRLLPTEGVSH